MAYQPIENYGIIGDMRTLALVGVDGSIDWLCYPHFDSPSVFATVLDDKKGGRYKIAPAMREVTYKQLYWPETNILINRFLSPDGVGEVTDFMPVGAASGDHGHTQLVRMVKAARGTMAFQMECRPAFDYARARHEVQITDTGAAFHSAGLSLGLETHVPLRLDGEGVVITCLGFSRLA